ncbi:hypothetical protein H6G17_03510 [Chroococcidiopsis sp. FACHB-1243]|uniref:hypothetical protein n=1 Tax=Chroococcidiopsis sp. [FACHB-1243] TaxID=2692781 RepID=UPI00177D25D3|nr:hypothetical protein [Chroococcidiopsis sp. [FACHB-1243]]MBD2304585.1 hypothetical protein [Chroococcidiopsis sp. [FACHB-1243]]
MRSQAENGTSILERTKDWVAAAGDTFSHTIARITTTTQDAAGSLADKAIAPIASTQAIVFQSWLEAHPTVERSLQVLNWAIERPIISVIILLFVIAIVWSLIKSIGRLFEKFCLSVLQMPLRLGHFLIQMSWRSLHLLSARFILKRPQKQLERTHVLPTSDVAINYTDQHQRLLEISAKLALLNQEQNDLMREALSILSSNQIATEDIPQNFQPEVFSNIDKSIFQSY